MKQNFLYLMLCIAASAFQYTNAMEMTQTERISKNAVISEPLTGHAQTHDILIAAQENKVDYILSHANPLNVNQTEHLGLTPLHYVFDSRAIGALIKNGARINAQDCAGRTPLHAMAKITVGSQAIDVLAAAKANVNMEDWQGATPLHYAVEGFNSRNIDILIKNGASLENECAMDWYAYQSERNPRIYNITSYLSIQTTPLDTNTLAVYFRNHKSKCGAACNCKNIAKSATIQKFTPLELATYLTSSHTARALLDGGAILTAKAKEYIDLNRNSELSAAIRHYRQRIAKNVKQASLATSSYKELHWAARYDDFESIKKLANQSNVNDTDAHYGITPLHLAVEWANIRSIEALIAKGANVNAQDKHGATPLFYAPNAEVLKLLLNCNANPATENFLGQTALHVLCQDRCANELISLLIDKNEANERKIYVNKQDALGATALHYAVSEGAPSTVETLIKAGASTEIPCNIDWSQFKKQKSRNGGILATLVAAYLAAHTEEIESKASCRCKDVSLESERKYLTPLALAVINACDPEVQNLYKSKDLLFDPTCKVESLLALGAQLTQEIIEVAQYSANKNLTQLVQEHQLKQFQPNC